MLGGWKILNDERANRYIATKAMINTQCTDLRMNGIKVPAVETLLAPRALGLGPPDEAVNECWLFHGTSPDHLVQILSTGLNERLASTGLFGAGAYFCDRIEKADQYVTPDSGDANLSRMLFPEGHPGGEIFYVFVARVTMGCTVRTIDALTDLDRGGATTAEAAKGEEKGPAGAGTIFANAEKRDLAEVPGSSPPVRFHSLTGELGGVVRRFKEFVIFNTSATNLAYLIAYRRNSHV